jgi:hypothetical protein
MQFLCQPEPWVPALQGIYSALSLTRLNAHQACPQAGRVLPNKLAENMHYIGAIR